MGTRSFTSAAIAAVRGWLRRPAAEPAPGEPAPPFGGLPPEELVFVRGILADPADSLPRLVYADWLEERGDPRGEFLRLATNYRDEPRDFSRDRPALAARLAELRPLLPAGWRTAFDTAGRFHVVWGRYVRSQVAERARGERLRAVADRWKRGPEVGDYIYVLTLAGSRLALVSRMRVRRREPAPGLRNRPRHFPWQWGEAVVGDEGLPIRLGEPVPAAVAGAARFLDHKGNVRRVRLDPDGRVANHGAVHGGARLTPETALLFDALLNGWADWLPSSAR